MRFEKRTAEEMKFYAKTTLNNEQTNENNQRITCGEEKKTAFCNCCMAEMISTNSRPLVGSLRMMAFVIVICSKVLNIFNGFPSAVKTYCCVYNRNWRPYSHEARACHRKCMARNLIEMMVRFFQTKLSSAPSVYCSKRWKPNCIESFILIGNNC